MFSVEDIIPLAIQMEQNAEKVFREAANRSSTASLALLLRWLAEEEVNHAKYLSELKPETKKTVVDHQVKAQGDRLLKGILGDQTFSLNSVDLAKMDRAQSLLEAAIEFERDTVLFYEMIRSFVKEKEDLALFDNIIKEENNHIDLLQEFLERFQSRGARRTDFGITGPNSPRQIGQPVIALQLKSQGPKFLIAPVSYRHHQTL